MTTVMMDLIAGLVSRLRPENGQTLAEYTIILALIIVGAVLTLGVIGATVAGYWSEAGNAFP